ncbi:hypothetical protein VTL71DRAFT_1215 [Oculimacula yallundae]|uniref:Uncharacterized protein n=1 Tax=Oculimacula yallundae TaxID=86028 RepID=A0ABR4CA44_9HELO
MQLRCSFRIIHILFMLGHTWYHIYLLSSGHEISSLSRWTMYLNVLTMGMNGMAFVWETEGAETATVVRERRVREREEELLELSERLLRVVQMWVRERRQEGDERRIEMEDDWERQEGDERIIEMEDDWERMKREILD